MIIAINPKSFITDFINPVNEVNKEGRVIINYDETEDELYSVSENKISTIKLYNTLKCAEIKDPLKKFAINTLRLNKGLSCIDSEHTLIDLEIDEKQKNLNYNGDDLRFSIKLLNEALIPVPKFNVETFKKFPFEYKIEVNATNFKNLQKALIFSSETGKFQVSQEDDKIYFNFGEMNSTSNDTDSMKILMCSNYTEQIPCRIYDAELLRLIIKTRSDFTMNLNQNGVLFVGIQTNNTKLNYITTPLKK